ncbi:MAG: acyloxyacyl hydrolase [Chitinophagales bacterium]
MKKGILFVFCVCMLGFLSAQDQYFFERDFSKYVLEANGSFGKIFKHTASFDPDVTAFTYNFEAGFSVRNFGDKPWQQKLHYPEVGATFIHSFFGDKAVFGTANGVYAHAKFWFNRNKIADTYFRVGSGLAWLDKPYHPNDNSTNNVIGSKLNNITQLKFGADFHVHERVDLALAFTFTHYSNAKTQSPNLGINIPALTLGVRYSPFTQDRQYTYSDTLPSPEKRNEYNYQFSVGTTNKTVGGAKFPIYVHSFYYSRYTSVANKVWVGASWTTDMQEHDKLLFAEETDKLKFRSSDLSLFVADEILLGKTSIYFLLGAYLIDKEFRGAPIYAKLGVNYYYLDFGKHNHKLFVGVNMKTHYSIAQYMTLSTGISF